MIYQGATAAIVVHIAITTFAGPAASAEALPVTALTIEKSIPFEVTDSHINNYDVGVYFGLGSVWILVHPNLLRIDPLSYAVTPIELKGVAGPIRAPAFGRAPFGSPTREATPSSRWTPMRIESSRR